MADTPTTLSDYAVKILLTKDADQKVNTFERMIELMMIIE